MARSCERSTKVGDEVNGLGEILFLHVMSPNLIVGRYGGFNGLLGIPILSITLRTYFEERSLAVSTVTQYFVHVISVLLELRAHSSNLPRVVWRHGGARRVDCPH